MPASMAAKLATHFARFAASAAHGSARHAGAGAASGVHPGASSTWAGLSGSSSSGAGIGGAKYHAGRGAHSHFTNSGRALANANAAGSHDGSTVLDEEEEAHRPGSSRRLDLSRRLASGSPQQLRQQPQLQRRLRATAGRPSGTLLIAGTVDDISLNASLQRRSVSGLAAAGIYTRTRGLALPAAVEDAAQDSFGGARPRSLTTSAAPDARDAHGAHVAGIEVGSSGSRAPIDISDPGDAAGQDVEQLLAPQRPAPAQKDIEEILRILNAATQRDIASGRPSSLEDAAARIATLPPSEQTSELYEKLFASVRAFYRGRPGGVVSAANKLSDIYRTMIQHDCMPTAKTFEHVICTLCEADAEDLAQTGASSSAPAHAGFRLDQAVMLLSGAHAASRYFERVDAYTAVLRACAARGRYEGAQTVTRLMDANPGLQRVTPSTTAYINLLDATSAVGSSSAQPASSQERAERLRTCVSISESYEELARAKQRWTELRASRIGDALMLAHMRLGDVPGALRLLETRTQERHDKPWDGTAASAATTGQTMSVVCEGFIDIGDLASASIWLEKLTTLSQAPTGSASFPLPEMEVLCRYLTALTGDEGAAKAKQEPSSSAQQVASILPQLRVVNTVFAAALAAPPIGSAKSNELNRLVVLHQLLRANAQAASQLFAKGRHDADVDALLDASLSHIHTYYSGYAVLLARTARNLATSTQAWPANKWVTNRQHGAATSALYLAATATVLVERSRHVDAASVLTYAAHAVPQVEAKGPVAWRQQRDHAVRAVRGVALDILAPAAESVVPSKVLLLAAVEYIWPALREHGDLPPQIVSRVASLYHQVCAEEDIHAVGLTESAWPRLLDALVHEETARPVDPQWLRQHGLVKFLSHASRLAADARPSLTAQAIDALAQRYGQDGSAFAQEYSTGRLQPSDPSEAPVQDASASPSAAPAAETSQDAEPVVEHDSSSVSSPLSSTATSLPSSASQGTSDHAAPIAKAARSDAPKKASTGVIDKKLGQWVSSRLNDAVGKIGSKRIPRAAMNDVNNFWRLVQTRAAEGVLAPLDSLLELLNVFGRNQMLQDVHTAYQLGMRVLHLSARKAANRTEQQQELDDAMIRALAHGGDVPAAAAHRHILINGGGRPSSDSYAALIANLHDTTDDALIAQELFEESQRLGIRPNTFLFNTVISKFARARKADLAVRLFEEMTSEPLRLRATTITYGAVINACTKTGDALGAERYFELMENDPKFEPRVPPYNTMMQFYCQVQPVRGKALHYYRKMQAAGVTPTEHTYKLLLDIHGGIEPRQLDEMDRVFEELANHAHLRVSGTHWAARIAAHGATDVEAAVGIFDSIASHHSTLAQQADTRPEWRHKQATQARSVQLGETQKLPDSVAYEALLAVFVAHGQTERAAKLVEQMTAAKVGLTAYVANLLIRAHAASGTPDGLARARALFNTMRDPPTGLAAQGNHVPGHRQHGAGAPSRSSPAEAAASDAKRVARSFAEVDREPSTWLELMQAEAAAGELEAAGHVFARMSERGYPAALVMRAQALLATYQPSPPPQSDLHHSQSTQDQQQPLNV